MRKLSGLLVLTILCACLAIPAFAANLGDAATWATAPNANRGD